MAVVGCGPFVDQHNLQDRADEPAGELGSGAVVAERFVARCDGLTAVDVQLAVYPSVPRDDRTLTLAIQEASGPTGSAPPLGTTTIDARQVEPNQWSRLAFPRVAGSGGQTFYLTAKATGPAPSPVTLWATGHAADPAGQRYAGSVARPGTLVYRAYCDESPGDVARQTLDLVARAGWLWPIVLLLVLVPGLGAALWLCPGEEDIAARLGSAAGWSVLLMPLTLAAATPFHLGAYIGIPLLLTGAVTFGVQLRRTGVASPPRPLSSAAGEGENSVPPLQRRWRGKVPPSEGGKGGDPGGVRPASALALLATAGALGVRAVSAKDLVVPAWGDSVQHAYVVQLIVQSGGVPATYGGLVAPQAFDYHFGFQALAAAAAVLSGASVPDAVLATGQVLSAVMALAAYRFARSLTGSRVAGAVAATLVGLVTTQPTYFVSWGRYPELAGLVALPAAYDAVDSALRPGAQRRHLVAAVAACAAMILVHPRVATFLTALALAETIVPTMGLGPRPILVRTGGLAAIGVASLAVCAPWIWRLWTAHHATVVAAMAWQPIDFPLDLATSGDDRWVLLLALVGAAVGVARRARFVWVLALGCAVILVLANPATFRLPVYLALNNGSLAIAAFLPATALVGYLVGSAGCLLQSSIRRPALGWAGALAVLGFGLTRAPGLVGVLNPTCVLLRPPDLAAVQWVKNNTPENARFVVNGFVWAPSLWIGSDAGYWLPVLAGRRTTLPPLFYGVGPASEVADVNATAQAVHQAAAQPAEVARLARELNARYVFVGTRGGDLDPGRLVESGLFRVDYGAGGDWVLELAEPGGAASSTTDTGWTPADVGTPSAAKAAGLRSTTSG